MGALRDLIESLPDPLRRSVFTHSSWVAPRTHSYERLEFLGDSVLGMVIAHHLYQRFPDRPEGDLAKIRAHVVSRPSCALVGAAEGLPEELVAEGARLGGEAAVSAPALAASESVIAEIVEAAIGAGFLHLGLDRVASAVVEAFADRIDYAVDEHVDYKTVLQEELARRASSVTYSLVEVTGPDHERRFTTAALVDGRRLGTGSGPSKKSSEQAAAREALARIGWPAVEEEQ
ncbi:MAG: ribonuclease III family protein [Gaiellales bacterium]